MKDYYKILGVKESASEEEIREHWIEWMRKLHPDQHQQSGIEDERVREINEAYQVLKHSSTRVEYDLKRAHDRRRKGFRVRRISILIVIFCFVLIPALLYVKRKVHIGVPSVSSTEHQTIVLREAGRQDLEVSRNGTIEPLTGRPEEVDAIPQEALNVETGPASKTEPAKAESPVQPAPSTAVTVEEVRQFMEEYKNRLKKMEVNPFMELFSKEAVENQVLPYADIRQGYLATFENSDAILYHLDVYFIQTHPKGAFVSGRYEMIQSLKGRNKQRTFRGNIQWDLAREGGFLKIKELKYGRDPE